MEHGHSLKVTADESERMEISDAEVAVINATRTILGSLGRREWEGSALYDGGFIAHACISAADSLSDVISVMDIYGKAKLTAEQLHNR